MAENKPISVDKATLELYEKAKKDGVNTVFDRAIDMKPCPIGAEGSCCKNCSMGPCRVPLPKKEGGEQKVGLCGATAATIAARNFCRMIAGGCAAHSDHGRGVAETFLLAAKGEIPNYGVKDIQKMYQLAMDFGIEIEGRDDKDIAVELGEKSCCRVRETGRTSGSSGKST